MIVEIGNLTKDVEFKGGEKTNIARFTIAVNRSKEESYFFDCVSFGRTAELANEFLKKGDKVYVQGDLTYRDWEDKYQNKHRSYEIIVNNLQFLMPKKGE